MKNLVLPFTFLLCVIIFETNGLPQRLFETNGYPQRLVRFAPKTPFDRCRQLNFDIDSDEGLLSLKDFQDFIANDSCRSFSLSDTSPHLDNIYHKCAREVYLFPKLPADISCAFTDSGKLEDVLHQPNCYRYNDILKCEDALNVELINPCINFTVRQRMVALARPLREKVLFADCKGEETIKRLPRMILPNNCAVTPNTSLAECIETGMRGSKIFEDYERVMMNDIDYTDFADKVNQALKSPDSHIEQCRIAFKIAKCVVNGADCGISNKRTIPEMIHETIKNVTICANVSLYDLEYV